MGATDTLRSSGIADLSTEMPVLRAFSMLGVSAGFLRLAVFWTCGCYKNSLHRLKTTLASASTSSVCVLASPPCPSRAEAHPPRAAHARAPPNADARSPTTQTQRAAAPCEEPGSSSGARGEHSDDQAVNLRIRHPTRHCERRELPQIPPSRNTQTSRR
jgi:hypothetical protein